MWPGGTRRFQWGVVPRSAYEERFELVLAIRSIPFAELQKLTHEDGIEEQVAHGVVLTALVGSGKEAQRPHGEIVGALTEALILDGTKCLGVRYTLGGVTQEARAGREVIVSAGSVNSPQLLELSGIGQPEVLQRNGIEVRHALAGVGENLRDHYAPRMRWKVKAPGLTYNDKARGVKMVWQALRYATTGKGLPARRRPRSSTLGLGRPWEPSAAPGRASPQRGSAQRALPGDRRG